MLSRPGRRKTALFLKAIDPRTTLKPERVLFFNPHGCGLNESAGLMVPHAIDALHQDGQLYFRSETVVRRFLEMEPYFREATDEEMQRVFEAKTFVVDDWNALRGAANTTLGRKLHGVCKSGVPLTVTAIQSVARRIKSQVSGNKQGRIVVPTSPKEFREFVRILADDYLESISHAGSR